MGVAVPEDPTTRLAIDELTPDRPDLVAAAAAVRAEVEADRNPGDPPIGPDELAADVFTAGPLRRQRAWVARTPEGRPAGWLCLVFEVSGDNIHLVTEEGLDVSPAAPAGTHEALLRLALTPLVEAGYASLLCFADSPAASARLASLGLEARAEERCSRLHVPDVDDGLLRSWVETGEAGPGADGYRLHTVLGAVPDDLLDAYVEAQAAMLDVPLDDLDYAVQAPSAARVRGRDERHRAQGVHPVTSLVVGPDGHGAGLSDLYVNGHRPTIGHQGDTGVARDHRGRGLGRWLKAATLLAARDAHPELTVVETYNAESNPWMLDINVAMGFRPHVTWVGHQGDLADVLAALG